MRDQKPSTSVAAPVGSRAVVLSGTAVIAVCYGLGRYAYGLFVPRFQAWLDLSATVVGVIGGMSHLGYAVGLLAAPWLTRRVGSERVAIGAGVAAAIGMAAMAASGAAIALGAAVLVAGVGSGLASPSLAQVVVDRLAPDARSSAQTWINSGTSLGLALSAPAVLLAVDWRAIWALFAGVAFLVAVAGRATLVTDVPVVPVAAVAQERGPGSRGSPGPATPTRMAGREARTLVAFAALLGLTSAGYWTFSRQQVLDGGMGEGWSVGFWVVIGACGVLGGTAGAMAERFGLVAALRVWILVWTLSLGALAIPGLPTPAALASAGGFGAAYMALTGAIIVWAVRVGPGAAAGVGVSFLALGIGQAVGTPLAGMVADTWTLSAVFGLSSVGSLPLMVVASAARSGR